MNFSSRKLIFQVLIKTPSHKRLNWNKISNPTGVKEHLMNLQLGKDGGNIISKEFLHMNAITQYIKKKKMGDRDATRNINGGLEGNIL